MIFFIMRRVFKELAFFGISTNHNPNMTKARSGKLRAFSKSTRAYQVDRLSLKT